MHGSTIVFAIIATLSVAVSADTLDDIASGTKGVFSDVGDAFASTYSDASDLFATGFEDLKTKVAETGNYLDRAYADTSSDMSTASQDALDDMRPAYNEVKRIESKMRTATAEEYEGLQQEWKDAVTKLEENGLAEYQAERARMRDAVAATASTMVAANAAFVLVVAFVAY